MNESESRGLPVWSLFVVLALLCSTAGAASVDDLINIDRTQLAGSWYRIMFNSNGDYVLGEGDGQGWYYYPATGWWRHWFYNEPYNPNREGVIEYRMFITASDYSRGVSVEINASWTRPEWSLLGHNRPPMPEDVPTESDEAKYMNTQGLTSFFDVGLGSPEQAGSVEPNRDIHIRDYNPDWVSIDIRGKNAYVMRGVLRECRSKGGACYNPANGSCYVTSEDNCPYPYQWMGSGTSCTGAPTPKPQLDFGDAPNTYGTTLASNGARHTIVSGIYLGQKIDAENDGIPGPNAMGDDNAGIDDEDGVVFTTDLTPGQTVGVEVTASIAGYLNAWIDFNRNGTFDGRDEQIFSDTRLVSGANRLSFNVPAGASTGDTFARFRFNTRGLLPSYGPAEDGEVEDYKVSIVSAVPTYLPSPGRGGLKWSQPPQSVDAATPFLFNGWDELSALHLHQILADDWQCTDDQPITGFQWWGSFEGWTKASPPVQQPLAFHIGIWTDAPGKIDSNHPGSLIWETYCTHWTWSIAGYDDDIRGIAPDETCFQFTALLSQDQWFYQTPTVGADGRPVPTVYWLSIAAVYDIQTSAPQNAWGWTTRPHSFNDAAVRIADVSTGDQRTGSWPPSLASQWLTGEPVEYPRGIKWDLAFELLTNQGSQAGQTQDPASGRLAPVYRFWSDQIQTYFYTIDQEEKDFLIRDFSKVWRYDGIVFYAYPPEQQPVGGKPVHRFWSASKARYYYTTSDSEKDRLIQDLSMIWSYEGIGWYAF